MKDKRGQIQSTIQQTPKKSKWWTRILIILILIVVGCLFTFYYSVALMGEEL